MTRALLLGAALLALAGCQSARNLDEGERLTYRCAGDKEFSLRTVDESVEIYAAGETHRLEPLIIENGRAYSNGVITYTEAGGNTTLTGLYGGPYESCDRQRGDWWPDIW